MRGVPGVGNVITAGSLDSLSRREREVLAWILLGLSTNQISRELGISPKTVETHRTHIANKLQLQYSGSTSALWLTAIANGWIKRGENGGVVLGFEYQRKTPDEYITVRPQP